MIPMEWLGNLLRAMAMILKWYDSDERITRAENRKHFPAAFTKTSLFSNLYKSLLRHRFISSTSPAQPC